VDELRPGAPRSISDAQVEEPYFIEKVKSRKLVIEFLSFQIALSAVASWFTVKVFPIAHSKAPDELSARLRLHNPYAGKYR